MSGSTTEVSALITPSGQNSIFRSYAVDASVFHVHTSDSLNAGHAIHQVLSVLLTNTNSISHDQIEREVLDKVCGIKGKRASIERMKHRMPSSICGTGTSISLTSLAELERLASKSTLIDLSLFSSRERKAIGF